MSAASLSMAPICTRSSRGSASIRGVHTTRAPLSLATTIPNNRSSSAKSASISCVRIVMALSWEGYRAPVNGESTIGHRGASASGRSAWAWLPRPAAPVRRRVGSGAKLLPHPNQGLGEGQSVRRGTLSVLVSVPRSDYLCWFESHSHARTICVSVPRSDYLCWFESHARTICVGSSANSVCRASVEARRRYHVRLDMPMAFQGCDASLLA